MQMDMRVGKGIGMIETLFGIFKKEGALALYKGYAPAATRAIVNSSCAVGLYKPILAVINDNPSSSQVTPLKFKVLASLTSGAITQIFASPVDVLKVHLQANKGKNLEATHTIALKLLEQKGIAFFWTALRASMVRSALGVCATLATYDHAKDFISVEKKLLDEGLALHFVCSALSGLAATIVSCPADVIKTRMIVYHAQEKRSTLGWFKHIVRTEGVKALFTGFVPIYIRLCPWQMLFFISFEELSFRLYGTRF
jgi:solute carrier family 25 uncoupling protein 27